jgi:hemerythrin-like metal-binding protein
MKNAFWKDEYSVGVEKLDMQHQQILEIMDKLSYQAASLADSNLISATLTAMLQYARQHFTTEEELMQKYSYPDIEQQKKQHSYFLKRTAELSILGMETKEIACIEMAEFLKNWWVIHILKWDMKYKEFFEEKKLHTAQFERAIELL